MPERGANDVLAHLVAAWNSFFGRKRNIGGYCSGVLGTLKNKRKTITLKAVDKMDTRRYLSNDVILDIRSENERCDRKPIFKRY